MTKEADYFGHTWYMVGYQDTYTCLAQLGPQEWETLIHCRNEQGKLYFWGSRPGKKPQLCRQPGSQLCSITPQLLRESVPGYTRPHLKRSVILHTEQLSMSKQGNDGKKTSKSKVLSMWLRFSKSRPGSTLHSSDLSALDVASFSFHVQ